MALALNRTERFRSVQSKTEIDQCTHQWLAEGNEIAVVCVGDNQNVLGRGRRFCDRRLLRWALSSEAARRVSWLAGWSCHVAYHGCACARLEHTGLTTISIYYFFNNLEHLQQYASIIAHPIRSERARSMCIYIYIAISMTPPRVQTKMAALTRKWIRTDEAVSLERKHF